MITISTVESEADVLAILAIQQENLRQNVPIDEQISDGFLTDEYQSDLLWKMNNAARTIIAKDSASRLVGYAVTMLPEFALALSDPLFFWIKELEYKGKPLQDYAYYVLGQVCVKKGYRGQKIFQRMSYMHREMYSSCYQLLITSISSKNNHSLRAHVKVGFETIHMFHDPTLDETWHVVLWDWQK